MEFYSAPTTFRLKQYIDPEKTKITLQQLGFRERAADQRVLNGDFIFEKIDSCKQHLENIITAEELAELQESPLLRASGCLIFQNPETAIEKNTMNVVFFDDDHEILFLFQGASENSLNHPELQIELPPQLLAQYINQEPILNETHELRDIPPACLNSVLSIEDPKFLEHQGVSLKSILRAIIVNLLKGRLAQGGSTITQQTVKNYFLTSERTFSRKIREAAMSILLEKEFTKDQILETYLNIIYMGQSGAFQLRGLGSASKYYFNKNLSLLNLSECALLAAIINNPGGYNPFKNPEKATQRRRLVLSKLKQHAMAPLEQIEEALQSSLPQKPQLLAQETAPYFLDAVRRELKSLNIPQEGAQIYTSLNPQLQQWAESDLQNKINELETENKLISKYALQGKKLEATLISMDLQTGLIDVLIGGRSFKTTQFNRALDAHRQIGSLIKPFVFLTAFQKETLPTSLIQDNPVEFKFGKQIWKPENYDKLYHGEIPAFYALVNSLNAATAQLGMSVGLSDIIENLKLSGLTSKVQPYPSLLLGSFELYPIEIFKMYASLATLGKKQSIGFIKKINLYKKEVYQKPYDQEPILDPIPVAELVGVLKQSPQHGTAKSIRTRGFTKTVAGKTGTTNDYKDAWFIGFTPSRLTLVWVGYDDNSSHKLTGSSAAVPLWTSFMMKATENNIDEDFSWPKETQKENYKLNEFEVYKEISDTESTIELIERE